MIHFFWMFVVGLMAGALARFFMPGHDHLGIVMTALLGIAGSFVGGLVTRVFSTPKEGTSLHPAGFVMSIVGAMILLFVWHHLR
jgi:uncharacterized membrane protein YeaQ/YmgE (transglycosylase-associated protein family)